MKGNSVGVWQRVLDRVAPLMEPDVSVLDRLDGLTRGPADGPRPTARLSQAAEGAEPATA
ncbi:MAG TPA: hypothetical protein VGN19_08985 [Pedococcus sp.]|nr:hypothetical protein [Pedococcus sp.]